MFIDFLFNVFIVFYFAVPYCFTITSKHFDKINSKGKFDDLYYIMCWMLWVRLAPLLFLSLACCTCCITCGYYVFEDCRTNRRMRDDDYFPNNGNRQTNRNNLLNFINKRAKDFQKNNDKNEPESCPICYEDFQE